MREEMTRRRALQLAVGAAATSLTHPGWIFALNRQGTIVKVAVSEDVTFEPQALTREDADSLGRLVDTILPRTDTPGALDARVHEYIDLALSVGPEESRQEFLSGFEWLKERCRSVHGKALATTTPDELRELLRPLSDEHPEHPPELEVGATFFADLKRRTVFGYYTSREGRVEELGLPETVTMETYRGCRESG